MAGEKLWKLFYHPKVKAEDVPRLDAATRQRVRRAIEKKLLASPEDYAKPLAYTQAGLWSLRVGDWRVLFAMRADELWILRIGHRSDVYEATRRHLPPQSSP